MEAMESRVWECIIYIRFTCYYPLVQHLLGRVVIVSITATFIPGLYEMTFSSRSLCIASLSLQVLNNYSAGSCYYKVYNVIICNHYVNNLSWIYSITDHCGWHPCELEPEWSIQVDGLLSTAGCPVWWCHAGGASLLPRCPTRNTQGQHTWCCTVVSISTATPPYRDNIPGVIQL